MGGNHVEGHLRWGATGEASASFRVDPQRSSDGMARLVAAVGGLPAPGVVVYGPGPDDWRVGLAVAEPAADAALSVLRAGSRAVLRPFGLRPAAPGPRAAGACAARAARQARALAAFAPVPCDPGEERAGLREVPGCGYAVARGGARYLACFTARPSGVVPLRWPLPAERAPWRGCVALRRAGAGAEAAFVAGVEAPDLVSLGEAAARLSHELRASGWDAVRPGSGQLALAVALGPGGARPPLPGHLFFALARLPAEGPPRPAAPWSDGSEGADGAGGPGGPGGGSTAVRVVRGPRRGLVVPLDGPLDVGRGGSGLDLADDGIGSRHLRLEPRPNGVSLRCGPGGTVLVDGEPATGERLVAPGTSLQLGRSELVLLHVGPTARKPAAGGSRAAAVAVEVSVRVEGGDREWSVSLDAPPGATVADVMAAVCTYLGLPGNRPHCLYAAGTGALLAPEGTWDAARVGRGEVLVVGPLAPDATVVRPGDGAPAPLVPAGGAGGGGPGSLVPLSRPPRTLLPPPVHRVELPPVPQQTSLRARGGHWQMAAGLGLGMTAVAGGLLFRAQLWLALAGGCTSVFSVTAGLMGDRSRRRHEERAFHDRLRSLDDELAVVLDRQRARWNELEPDAATLAAWVRARADRLWERRAGDEDFLRLRLGTGERAPLLALEGRGAPRDAQDRLGVLLAETLRRHARVVGAPVCLPAAAAPLLGIAGPEGPRQAMGRWLLLQAAALQAPRDLSIAVLATAPGWGWARWLPHVGVAGGPAVALDPERVDTLARLLAGRPDLGTVGGPWAVVLVDEEAAARPAVAPLLESPAARTTAIVLGADPRALPSRAAAVVALDGGSGVLSGAGTEGSPRPFRPEGVGEGEAAALARAMAPLTERGWRAPCAAADLGLLDLLGIDDPAGADTGRLWRRGA